MGTSRVVNSAPERVTIVTANGTTYRIPDMWLAGICQSSGCTVQAAIAFYIEMSELDALAVAR